MTSDGGTADGGSGTDGLDGADGTGGVDGIHREVGSRPVEGRETPTVLLRRTYDAAAADVWHACTDPERLGRWLAPVSGDLKPGGSYRLEGGASGEILACEPPELLRVGWQFGEDPDFSEVEVRLRPTADDENRTVLELEHVAEVRPEEWGVFGPGATGLVWDLTAHALHLHLRDGPAVDLAAWRESDEAREFMTRSSEAWGAAYEAAGAPPEVAADCVEATTSFYVRPREGDPSVGADGA